MARPLEVRITVSKGFSNLGETNEAEVSATFEVPEGEADLGAVVEEKFHEVRSALLRALESEPPKDAFARMETEVQGAVTPEPPSAAPTAGDSISELPSHEPGGPEPCETEGPITVAEEGAEESGPSGSEEGPPITPAQERTIQSLSTSARIGEAQLRAMLEDGYNGKGVAALTKREAAGLILELSQKQRARILRDKPEMASPRQNHKTAQEVFSRNGGTAESLPPSR
jgi:hypothetical protein